MTLLDAQPFDEARARRRRILIGAVVVGLLVLAWLAWSYRFYPQEHVVTKFFDALESRQFETAYGLWFNDPQWQQQQAAFDQQMVNKGLVRQAGLDARWNAQIEPSSRIRCDGRR